MFKVIILLLIPLFSIIGCSDDDNKKAKNKTNTQIISEKKEAANAFIEDLKESLVLPNKITSKTKGKKYLAYLKKQLKEIKKEEELYKKYLSDPIFKSVVTDYADLKNTIRDYQDQAQVKINELITDKGNKKREKEKEAQRLETLEKEYAKANLNPEQLMSINLNLLEVGSDDFNSLRLKLNKFISLYPYYVERNNRLKKKKRVAIIPLSDIKDKLIAADFMQYLHDKPNFSPANDMYEPEIIRTKQECVIKNNLNTLAYDLKYFEFKNNCNVVNFTLPMQPELTYHSFSSDVPSIYSFCMYTKPGSNSDYIFTYKFTINTPSNIYHSNLIEANRHLRSVYIEPATSTDSLSRSVEYNSTYSFDNKYLVKMNTSTRSIETLNHRMISPITGPTSIMVKFNGSAFCKYNNILTKGDNSSKVQLITDLFNIKFH